MGIESPLLARGPDPAPHRLLSEKMRVGRLTSDPAEGLIGWALDTGQVSVACTRPIVPSSDGGPPVQSHCSGYGMGAASQPGDSIRQCAGLHARAPLWQSSCS